MTVLFVNKTFELPMICAGDTTRCGAFRTLSLTVQRSMNSVWAFIGGSVPRRELVIKDSNRDYIGWSDTRHVRRYRHIGRYHWDWYEVSVYHEAMAYLWVYLNARRQRR
jgi:hypothetical protein